MFLKIRDRTEAEQGAIRDSHCEKESSIIVDEHFVFSAHRAKHNVLGIAIVFDPALLDLIYESPSTSFDTV